MNRRELIVATGGLAATALSGCLGVGDASLQSSGQEGSPTAERDGRTIVVSNSGRVKGEPDLAILHVGVETRGDSAGAVRDELATRSEQLRTALLEYGLDESAVTTDRFDIREEIDHRQMEKDGVRPDSKEAREKYVYYRGTHSFTVEVEAIDEVGAVIDTAVDAGANDVGRVTFTLSEEKRRELRQQALRKAIREARSEAEAIADEVGASLGEATVVDASDGRVSPVEREVAYEAAATETPGDGGQSTSVEAGEVTVSADVRIRYRMG